MTTPQQSTMALAELLAKIAPLETWTLAPCSHGGVILRRGYEDLARRHMQGHLQILPTEEAAYMVHAATQLPQLVAALEKVVGEADSYVGIGFDLSNESADLREALAGARNALTTARTVTIP